MYMKVFAHGKGRGEKATDYLLDEDFPNRQEEKPVLLRGDPNLTKELINSLDFKWKYTSGVLSWHPDDKVTVQKEQELMDKFEEIAFAGMEAGQYNILWVRHSHADHHEMHFVIPRVELSTGKSYNPCPPNWQKDFDPLRDFLNIKENWARPDDPERARVVQPAHADIHHNRMKRWGKEVKQSELDSIRELLINYAVEKIESGLVQNRDDIINAYKELGLSISRKGKDYISVQDTESNKKIRLKGGIFNESFTLERTKEECSKNYTEGQTKSRRSPHSENEHELERLRTEIARVHKKRSDYNRKRYAKPKEQLEIADKIEHENIHFQLSAEHELDIGLVHGQSWYNEALEQSNNDNSRGNQLNRGKNSEKGEFVERNTDAWTGTCQQDESGGSVGAIHHTTAGNDSSHGLHQWRTERNQVAKGINNERNRQLSQRDISSNARRAKEIPQIPRRKTRLETFSSRQGFTEQFRSSCTRSTANFNRLSQRAESMGRIAKDFAGIIHGITRSFQYTLQRTEKQVKSQFRMR